MTIIRAEHAEDTAEWLFCLAVRRRDGAIRDRPVYAQRPRSAAVLPQEAALASAPDVSVITARRVLNRFGSLHQIGEASIEDLQAIPGVGSKRATSIATLIHEPWKPPNPD